LCGRHCERQRSNLPFNLEIASAQKDAPRNDAAGVEDEYQLRRGAHMSNLAHRNNRLALILITFFFFMFALSIVLGVIVTAGH
jgi:hypothetical protein